MRQTPTSPRNDTLLSTMPARVSRATGGPARNTTDGEVAIGPGVGVDRGLGREGRGHRAAGGVGQRRHRQHPHGDPHPVAAQHAAAPGPGPGRACSCRHLVAVLPQEQLLQRRRVADQRRDPERGEVAHRLVEVVGVDVEADPAVEAGRRAPPPVRRASASAGSRVSATTVVRVRCRSSASVPCVHDPAGRGRC